ncbi:MAG: aquaporin [Anaerolineales bacterium]|nr:aquaporin [Anaerolineales bacterium]
MFNSKVFLAEFIGTFALVFVGTGATIVANGDLVGVALAYGLTLAVFFYAYGHISGTHVNPAVTFGLALNGSVKWMQAVFYWIAQFAGAILAVFFLKILLESLGADVSGMATVGALTEPQPILAMIVEAVLTFFLVNTYLHTAVAGKGGAFAGWAIGATLAFATLVGLPFTGAAFNPARTLATAIFIGPSLTNVYTYVIYFFGPLLGSTLAVIVSNFLNDVPEEVEDDEEDEEEDAGEAAK